MGNSTDMILRRNKGDWLDLRNSWYILWRQGCGKICTTSGSFYKGELISAKLRNESISDIPIN
ncbi:hypothetical protein MiSe_84250 [Microseira wollei NIES-4236]|uniref:Uncharacterized protein n=1 Tax=Microseira wollei NIES-4236 TaxID=2530354 RepID=A0AAV3XSW7_9CYAN|nr:hypothetical protein MiSe_84250 [Microseira wollei NIES-4236]